MFREPYGYSLDLADRMGNLLWYILHTTHSGAVSATLPRCQAIFTPGSSSHFPNSSFSLVNSARVRKTLPGVALRRVEATRPYSLATWPSFMLPWLRMCRASARGRSTEIERCYSWGSMVTTNTTPHTPLTCQDVEGEGPSRAHDVSIKHLLCQLNDSIAGLTL